MATSKAPPTTIIDLDRSRQILTRSQEAKIRRIFPFFRLPAEIRNLIYEGALDTDAAQRILQRYYEDIKDTDNGKGVTAPLIYSKCPTIFTVNRQTFVEASFLVRKRSLTFEHGLFDLLTIQDFLPDSLIRTVSSIRIDNTGHPLFKNNILTASWVGYMCLMEELAETLKAGHQLKSLTISLDDEALVEHVTKCWGHKNTCGFRDGMRRAGEALRGVRNVREVKLVGFPEPFATELKQRMQSAPISFSNLPRELRDQIYNEMLDWSEISVVLKRDLAKWVDKTEDIPYSARSTPTILQLSREITAEALLVLRKKPLVLECPAESSLLQERQVPNLIRLMTSATLQNVQHLVVQLKAWEWIHGLKPLLLAWAPAPAPLAITSTTICAAAATAGTSDSRISHVKTLHLTFHDNLKDKFLANADEHYPDNVLHDALSFLAEIRGLRSVIFDGDLPTCYSQPLVQSMTSPVAGGVDLPKLMSIKSSGEEVESMHDERETDGA
ncbi:hypothetical protein B0A50_03708 [Salinomyces thailandicus]|uniref:2EXR domain-containing protein n=1 Tax=Salinomyces thailandicus TaxID=706561 RepID=A0A4U0U2S7_9PEZI|nr:hypothetical protein B0A50_03708 [Salinomyces thailandica]